MYHQPLPLCAVATRSVLQFYVHIESSFIFVFTAFSILNFLVLRSCVLTCCSRREVGSRVFMYNGQATLEDEDSTFLGNFETICPRTRLHIPRNLMCGPHISTSHFFFVFFITLLFSTYRNTSSGINRVIVGCPFFWGKTLRHCLSASRPFATNVAVATLRV